MRGIVTVGLKLLLVFSLLILAAPTGVGAESLGPPARAVLVENAGQFGPGASYLYLNGPGQTWLTPDAIWIMLAGKLADDGSLSGTRIRLSLGGAGALEPQGRLPATISYFRGSRPDEWRGDVPSWGAVRYRELTPGVDLLFGEGPVAGWPWRLEGRGNFTLSIEGAQTVRLGEGGLILETRDGALTLPLPGGSMAAGLRESAPGRFTLALTLGAAEATGALAPEAGAADLAYSTFLGGGSSDTSYAVHVDGAGDAYLAGRTLSANFPTAPTPGAFDTTLAETDAFVAKLRPGGAGATDLLYATYLGGSCVDAGYAVAADSSGNAYVAGATCSTDFPVSSGGYDKTCGTGDDCADYDDAFLAVLNASGSALLYSSYFGGANNDFANGIALSSGIAYLAGETSSTDFPTTSGGYDRACGSDGACDSGGDVPYADAFLAKVNRTLNGTAGLVYGTYLGGNDIDTANGVAVTGNQATLAGVTYSPDFPGGGFAGESDAFGSRIDTGVSGSGGLTFSRLIGGAGFDEATAVAVDSGGNAFLTGETRSTDFPVTGQGYVGGTADAFVTRLGSNGSVSYAACVGGTGRDVGHGLALGASGLVTLTGFTESSDFPATSGAFDTTLGGARDIFGLRMNLSLAAPVSYATYLGGTAADEAFGVGLDVAGRAYITGFTPGGGYPATTGAFDTTYNGSIRDAVMSVVIMQSAPPQVPQVQISASGTAAVLSWQPVTLDVNGNPTTVTKYEVYRSLLPFFAPTGTPYAVVNSPVTTLSDAGVLANVGQNYYYIVRAVSVAGLTSADSKRTGEFGFDVVKGSQ